MSLRPFKFIVQAVLLEEENGIIKGERQSEPVVFYSVEAVQEWLNRFADEVKVMNGDQERTSS
jgi:hypothetical protein